MSRPDLWNFKKLLSKQYPVVGALVVHTPQTVIFDLKPVIKDALVSGLFVRVVGSIVKTVVGVGAATGKENPEALVRSIRARHTPDLGTIARDSLSARGIISQGVFDRGYSIRATDVDDAVAAVAVDFIFPLVSKMPGSIQPVEWGFPMSLFDSYQLFVDCGGREQVFSGGTAKWDLTGLQIEVWGDLDNGVAGAFHLVEEFERTVPILQTQSDKEVELEKGWLYTHLLLMAERDDVLVDDIVNGVHIASGGNVWTPKGELNRAIIQRWNRETHVNNTAEDLTGLLYVPMLRDGMYKRAVDGSDNRISVQLDVTVTSGVEQVKIKGRRIRPMALRVAA